jgi:hypothetical protein
VRPVAKASLLPQHLGLGRGLELKKYLLWLIIQDVCHDFLGKVTCQMKGFMLLIFIEIEDLRLKDSVFRDMALW